jgi:hypothetical protein
MICFSFNQEVGSQKSEVGSQKSEVGSQKLEEKTSVFGLRTSSI